jgi:hypothetical protein
MLAAAAKGTGRHRRRHSGWKLWLEILGVLKARKEGKTSQTSMFFSMPHQGVCISHLAGA